MVRRKNSWVEYFAHIRPVCPWSGQAYRHNQIVIKKWRGQVQPLHTNQAHIYIYNRSPRLLKKLAQRLEVLHPECEFLYSHPSWHYNAAPYPCVIQQDKQTLHKLRENIGYFTTAS